MLFSQHPTGISTQDPGIFSSSKPMQIAQAYLSLGQHLQWQRVRDYCSGYFLNQIFPQSKLGHIINWRQTGGCSRGGLRGQEETGSGLSSISKVYTHFTLELLISRRQINTGILPLVSNLVSDQVANKHWGCLLAFCWFGGSWSKRASR